MCGRTCCTLSPDLLPYACTTVTKNKDGKRNIPQWSTNKFIIDLLNAPTEEVSNDVEDSPMDSFEERLNRLRSDK